VASASSSEAESRAARVKALADAMAEELREAQALARATVDAENRAAASTASVAAVNVPSSSKPANTLAASDAELAPPSRGNGIDVVHAEGSPGAPAASSLSAVSRADGAQEAAAMRVALESVLTRLRAATETLEDGVGSRAPTSTPVSTSAPSSFVKQTHPIRTVQRGRVAHLSSAQSTRVHAGTRAASQRHVVGVAPMPYRHQQEQDSDSDDNGHVVHAAPLAHASARSGAVASWEDDLDSSAASHTEHRLRSSGRPSLPTSGGGTRLRAALNGGAPSSSAAPAPSTARVARHTSHSLGSRAGSWGDGCDGRGRAPCSGSQRRRRSHSRSHSRSRSRSRSPPCSFPRVPRLPPPRCVTNCGLPPSCFPSLGASWPVYTDGCGFGTYTTSPYGPCAPLACLTGCNPPWFGPACDYPYGPSRTRLLDAVNCGRCGVASCGGRCGSYFDASCSYLYPGSSLTTACGAGGCTTLACGVVGAGACAPCGPYSVLPVPAATSIGTAVDTTCSGGVCATVTQPTATTCNLFGCTTTPIGPPNLASITDRPGLRF
jgi:hypothetical protein